MTTFVSLRCYGGPFDGRDQLTTKDVGFYWYVTDPMPHLVATTNTLEYSNLQSAQGCYVRQTRRTGRAAGEEILLFRPLPGLPAAMVPV